MPWNILIRLDQWQGSLQELADKAAEILSTHPDRYGAYLRPPSRSLVVDYRSSGLISPAEGKRYRWKHLVQLILGCVLVQGGLSRKEAARRLQSLSPAEMIALLESPESSADSASTPEPIASGTQISPENAPVIAAMLIEAVRLLAAGLIYHFRRARQGDPLIHGTMISPWIKGAMTRIASLYVRLGLPVRYDGAHTLIAQCLRPLRADDWGFPPLDWPEFPFRGMRLLDPDTRLPTLDCIELARQTASELDLREQWIFAQLNSVCDQFSTRGDEAYELLREFVVRHPVTRDAEIRKFLQDNSLQLATAFLSACYEPPQPHHLVRGALTCCHQCRAPMGAAMLGGYLACPARQCSAFDVPVAPDAARELPLRGTLIAKAHILVYWCAPGLDEINLYDVAKACGLDASLYPGRDKCDLGLDGNTVGIDIKSHNSPFLLAEVLNRSIGGLALFPRKVVAVNDQSLARFDGYLDIVQRECVRTDIEIVSVSTLRRQLKARS